MLWTEATASIRHLSILHTGTEMFSTFMNLSSVAGQIRVTSALCLNALTLGKRKK